MSDICFLNDLDVSGKRVLVRVDFNVPLDAEARVIDTTRIEAAVPTIRYLLGKGVRVVLASHLGRPKGRPDAQYSLEPVATELARILSCPVTFLSDCVGEDVERATHNLNEGGVILLQNLRFHEGEEKNDPDFCRSLSRLADAYVNDAFGTAHRAHASTTGVAELMKARAAGFLLAREIEFLGKKTADPERPFVVILGGAKVSDKVTVIESLLRTADTILIGGAMTYTFKLAQGETVGHSLSEPDKIEVARTALESAAAQGVRFLLPADNLITDALDFDALRVGDTKVVSGDIPDGWEGIDIGPRTIARYEKEITEAHTILWNGPMGIFEIEASSRGTFAVAAAVAANRKAISIIGGGDSVSAINQSGFADQVTFMSTGGGASLEFLEGRVLPGVAALGKLKP